MDGMEIGQKEIYECREMKKCGGASETRRGEIRKKIIKLKCT